MNIPWTKYRDEFSKFIRSTDFSKAVVLSIAMVIPIFVFSEIGLKEWGISMAVGCLLSSPSDITGTFKHKVVGVVIAAILGAVSFLIGRYAEFSIYSTIPMLLVMIFSISYLSVYGFRASLVSFSGLLAVVISFAGIQSGIAIWHKALLILAGGLWYLSLSILWYFIKPKRAIEQQIAETMELTAQYLRTRADFLRSGTFSEDLQKELFRLQEELNEHHESLRELLIQSRSHSGGSGYMRKRLLIFIDLVDILELAMSHPIDYQKMHMTLGKHAEILEEFATFSRKLALHLEGISLAVYKNKPLPENKIQQYQASVSESLDNFRNRLDITTEREAVLALRNLFDYQQRQARKIMNIDRVLRNLKDQRKLKLKEKEVRDFLTPQDYSWKVLSNNFNFDSAIFRHSIRMSLVVVIGYLIGVYFSVQNAYWILLTIIVIMRPNYGLTKQRTKNRIIGTLIGGVIAVGVVFLTSNPTVYAILGILSLTMAFSLIQKNYTTAATFITLSIIFIYALPQPEVLKVIQFRVLDTIVGAALAAAGNFFLWPKWEAQTLEDFINSSIEANYECFLEIDKYYHDKETLPTSYKLARKKAFLEMGNLSGAFQRMTQEPRSQQENPGLIFEITVLNQTFLSALASLGTYIRNHPTTKPSAYFETTSRTIQQNLKNCQKVLEDQEIQAISEEDFREASEKLEEKFQELSRKRDEEIRAGKEQIDRDFRLQLQEARLVTDQLLWLRELSEKLLLNIQKLKQS
ncbi:MAG: FUSC family membrane protein [Christiangramia sp.]|uniref:FUSC family protein n=1 Tax=Christiangramia sp. TaxID=1931228 RepID=UPI0032424754